MRAFLIVVVVLLPFLGSLDRPPSRAAADGSASVASTACPENVGRGGEPDVLSSATHGGDGCVVFEYGSSRITFVHTGAPQTWTVPPGVSSVVVHLVGAGGGGGRSGQATFGGGGGYATGRLDVATGQQFTVIVGGGGRRHCAADVPPLADLPARHNFSFGGGGVGNGVAPFDCTFASGGGRSAVREIGANDDLVTAGGGGGGGYSGAGGAAGGLLGANGGGQGGGGGTQSAGGGSSAPETGVGGIKYAGGWAGYSLSDRNAASEGGGGGGGYYGGGAGGNNGGGGGGSSYIGLLTAGSTIAGSGRDAGVSLPLNSAAPSLPAISPLGESVTGTPGAWVHGGSVSYSWQFSSDGVSYADIPGATGITYAPLGPGYLRLVETRRNFLGATSTNSTPMVVPDTRLAALSVSTGALTPAFTPTRTSYSVDVGHRTERLRITPTVDHPAATVRVGGLIVASGNQSAEIDLAVGDTPVIVRVELSGVATETTIVVRRAAAAVPGAPTISRLDASETTAAGMIEPPLDDGGVPIERYEYSIDGVTWLSLVGAPGAFEIQGLETGAEHELRVRAVNSVGAGASSVPRKVTLRPAVTTTTSVGVSPTTVATVVAPPTSAPAKKSERRSPTTTSSTSTITELPIAVASPTTLSMPVESTDPSVSARPVSPTTAPVAIPMPTLSPAPSDGLVLELVPEFGVGDSAGGAVVRATARGLEPGSLVQLEVRSNPTVIAKGLTDARGHAMLAGRLPERLEPGVHTLSLAGVAPGGTPLVSVVALSIGADGAVVTITPGSSIVSAIPDSSQAEKMVVVGAPPYDASRDGSGAVALAGAAVVLMSVAGASRGARSRRPSDDESEGGTSERDEDAEGSLASAEAKVLATAADGTVAWGDRSRLWALPGWAGLQQILRLFVRRGERWSTLVVRVLQDGTWIRSVIGAGGVVPWIVGGGLGFVAAQSVDGLAVPPAFGLIVAIVVVSFVDSLGGAVAWLVFTVSIAVTGGIASWFDVRTLLGLAVLFVALPLIAASFRPVLRARADGGGATIERFFDYLVVPLFLSYAASSVYRALNGLSGLDVVADAQATSLRWVCLFLAIGRMLVEDATRVWFPARRMEAALPTKRAPHVVVPYFNLVTMLGLYVLTAGPYMGTGLRTWVVMALMAVVPLCKANKDRFPNVASIHRWFPRGILRGVVLLYAVAVYGRWVIDVTGAEARDAVPLMLLPGIAIGIVDCFGRTGGAWPERRVKSLAGAILWAVSFSVVAGWLTP